MGIMAYGSLWSNAGFISSTAAIAGGGLTSGLHAQLEEKKVFSQAVHFCQHLLRTPLRQKTVKAPPNP